MADGFRLGGVTGAGASAGAGAGAGLLVDMAGLAVPSPKAQIPSPKSQIPSPNNVKPVRALAKNTSACVIKAIPWTSRVVENHLPRKRGSIPHWIHRAVNAMESFPLQGAVSGRLDVWTFCSPRAGTSQSQRVGFRIPTVGWGWECILPRAGY